MFSFHVLKVGLEIGKATITKIKSIVAICAVVTRQGEGVIATKRKNQISQINLNSVNSQKL
jgi:hypothetical protein